MNATFADLTAVSAAIADHFARTDMPEFVLVTRTAEGYTFESEDDGVPVEVYEPNVYEGDDGLWRWEETNALCSDRTTIDGYTLKLMEASEYVSPGFIAGQLWAREFGANMPLGVRMAHSMTIGCVIVSSDDGAAEWAWVTSDATEGNASV